MKVLLAHDPDANEPAPIADLRRAGFPPGTTMLILAVADVLVPPPGEGVVPESGTLPSRVQAAIDAAQQSVASARAEIASTFPDWSVSTDVIADSPAWGILRKASEWHPDLIAVGAHRQSAIARLVLGSVSQKVVHESPISVRVIKRGTVESNTPPKLMLGIDGSRDSDAATHALAIRTWPRDTSVVVAGVIDENLAVDAESTRSRCERAARTLTDRGLNTSIAVLTGEPKDALLAESERSNPDCIFVGARGLSMVERIVLGSVSAALAAHAGCSVEVVRPR